MLDDPLRHAATAADVVRADVRHADAGVVHAAIDRHDRNCGLDHALDRRCQRVYIGRRKNDAVGTARDGGLDISGLFGRIRLPIHDGDFDVEFCRFTLQFTPHGDEEGLG
jgi:hypothetical protein